MHALDEVLWLGIGGLPHLDLPALGELWGRHQNPRVALVRLAAGGDALRGIVSPSRRGCVAEAAASLSSEDVAATLGAELRACGGRTVRTDGPELATRLAEGAGWPPVISVRGALPDSPCVAIVGMRKASPGGRRFAARLAAELASEGVCVVSGLAFGIDRAAHEGALGADGRTFAVLAGGVGRPSPLANRDVAEAMLSAGGGLLSHVPALADAPGWRFPVRNRLIAGVAEATVVVEAAARGGSLSTAAHALRLGRALLAVPGPPWSEHSAGTNALLADGALMCRGVEDVLVALGFDRARARSRSESGPARAVNLTEEEATVLGAVSFTPEPVDAIARVTALPLVTLLGVLGRLEQLGLVEAPTPTTVVRTA